MRSKTIRCPADRRSALSGSPRGRPRHPAMVLRGVFFFCVPSLRRTEPRASKRLDTLALRFGGGAPKGVFGRSNARSDVRRRPPNRERSKVTQRSTERQSRGEQIRKILGVS